MTTTQPNTTPPVEIPAIDPDSPIGVYRRSGFRSDEVRATVLAVETQLVEVGQAICWPACPGWCETKTHEVLPSIPAAEESVAFVRVHAIDLSELVRIEQVEEIALTGSVTIYDPEVRIVLDDVNGLRASTAYALGDALIYAAKRLEQIAAAEVGR